MPKNKHCLGAPSTASHAPEKAVKLTIPEFCDMRGVYHSDRDIQIIFGKHDDGVKVRFDRFSLEQFARLALELLAVLYEKEPPNLPVRIVKPGPSRVPDITRGEDSAFIAGLRMVSEQMGQYADWLLHPDDTDAKPFPFEDQMVLSVVTSALAHGIRELAYDRHGVDGMAPRASDEGRS